MWNPSPPQGFSKSQSQVIIGRPPIPLFGAPQGIGVAAPTGDNLLALFPPIGDIDYNNYKFYQVNKGQASGVQTNMPLLIIDTLPDNTLLEPSGLDIRAFASKGRDLSQARGTGVVFDPQLGSIEAMQLSDDQLHLFVWQANGPIHEWVLSAPHVFPPDGTPSDFTFTPSEGTGRDIKFLENGNKMAIIGLDNDTIELYMLPSRNSFSSTPSLLQIFDLNFLVTNAASCEFSSGGTELYVNGQAEDQLYQWNLTAPNTLPDPLTPPDITFPYNPPVIASAGNMRMFRDGSAFYIMDIIPDTITKYITVGKNQIPGSNQPADSTFSIAPFDTSSRSMSLSVDESFIWFCGGDSDKIYEIFLPGISLPYEVQSIDNLTGPPTIYVWVNVDTVKDLEFIQLTFGKIDAINASSNTTWDSDYKMVLHMEESNLPFIDSTSNGNDVIGNLTAVMVDGKIARARGFNGAAEMAVNDSPSLDITTALTLSIWVKTDDDETWVMAKDRAGNPIRPYGIRHTTGLARFSIDNGVFVALNGITLIDDDQYHYMVGTYDGNEMKVYVDGILESTLATSGAIRTDDSDLFFGMHENGIVSLEGDIDESRISSIARTADWIKTEFNNQNDNDAFWHKTPLLTNNEDNFLVDEQGRFIEVVGQ